MLKIAIIDFLNQDIGVKVLFPEADYYVVRQEFDRSALYAKYNIHPIYHNVFQAVNDQTYDAVFVVGALYDGLDVFENAQLASNTRNKTHNSRPEIRACLQETLHMLQRNQFRRVCFFDNYDYDYDPNCIFDTTPPNVLFFKRNYNTRMTYETNVHPFPYITFGYQCNIDLLNDRFQRATKPEEQPRIFFSGTIFESDQPLRNRVRLYQQITSKLAVYNPGNLPHPEYWRQLNASKYGLDLLGVGDPNTRTFETFSCRTLRLAQRSPLKWPFDDDFCEETYFDDADDLFDKWTRLESDRALYQRCLEKQNEIVAKYMNVTALRTYIEQIAL
jgi:hypothetical protein